MDSHKPLMSITRQGQVLNSLLTKTSRDLHLVVICISTLISGSHGANIDKGIRCASVEKRGDSGKGKALSGLLQTMFGN